MSNNFQPHVDELPHLKDALARFQQLIATAQAMRDHLKVLKADTGDITVQRDSLLVEGDDLFGRMALGLQSLHGPKSERLREFGLKPRRRAGRPAKPTQAPPPPEVATTSPVAAPHEASGTTAAPAGPEK
jgi:hypothetical protein